MLGYEYRSSPEQLAQIDSAVREVLQTQSPDGYIGTHADAHRLEIWDIWCRKYVLLGLLADYDLNLKRSRIGWCKTRGRFNYPGPK